MDSQVPKSFHLQELPKLREGERVEVRQKDVGLRGSWHPGTIVALKAGRRVVEYDELLTDDGISKLREVIPCAKLIEKPSSSPGIDNPQKTNATSLATSMRSPTKRRGLLRPSPPICTEPGPLTWKGGLFVDVFYQDAWWEAILLTDVTSLDDDAFVDVIYPDEGDLARVHAKDLRISQFWDEVTGEWSLKGSVDLRRFLRRRGVGKKEVMSMVDSECRVNRQNSCTHSEMAVRGNELIQFCPSSNSRRGDSTAVPSSVKEVHEVSSILDSHQNVVPDRHGTDEGTNQNLVLTCTRNGDIVPNSSPSKTRLDISMSPGGSGHVTCKESENRISINGDSVLCHNDKNGNCSEEVIKSVGVGECLSSPLVKEEFIYDNLCSKRRRTEDACAISCARDAMYSHCQPTAASAFQNHHHPPLNNHLEIFKPNCGELVFGTEHSPDRGSTSYLGIGCIRGLSNLEGSNNCYSASMQHSFGSEDTGLLRRGIVISFSRRAKKENKLSNTMPVYRKHLLALAAPVQKSQKEYEQITSAGKAALDNGVHERAVRPTRKTGKEVPRNSREQNDQITPAGKPALEGLVHERVVKPGKQIEKASSSKQSQEDCDQTTLAGNDQITPAGKPGLEGFVHGRVVRPGRQIEKASPSKKSQETCDQTTVAGKPASKGSVHERAVRLRRRAGKGGPDHNLQEEDNEVALAGKAKLEPYGSERASSGRRTRAEMPIQGSQEENDQTISAGKVSLERDVHERAVRQGRQFGAKVVSCKSGEEHSQIISKKASSKEDIHERVTRFGGKAGEVSWSVEKTERRGRKDTLKSYKERLLRQKQAEALKRKASKMSSIAETDGKSAKLLKLSKQHGVPDQLETAAASSLSNWEEKSLKKLAQEIGRKAVLEAGFTIQYKPRRGKLSHDAIYTSPKGTSYWSLPKAWKALEKDERKGQMRVEKAVIQMVLSKISCDEKMRLSFENLDKFSATPLQEVMRKANFTYEELTDILLEDLGVLRKHMPSKKEKLKKVGKRGRGTTVNIRMDLKHGAPSKALSGALESSIVKKRGRKPKQTVEPCPQGVNDRALFSKLSSSLDDYKRGYVPKSEKNRLGLREGKLRTGLKGVKKAKINKQSSLIKALIEKGRNKQRGSSKGSGIETGTSRQESHNKKENAEKPRSGFRLEVRPSLNTDDDSEDLLCQSKRTVASWMIDKGAVLEKERIFYVDQTSTEILKEGVFTREGILCRCCKKVFTVQNFEEHGGSPERAPHCSLIFTSGRSLLDCQLEAWNVEVQTRKTHNYKGVTTNDTNDDTCLLCGDGGSLLCCDLCPSTFHASCLQLDNVPEGNWFCPKCRCGVCKDRNGNEEEDSMAVCRQCEHRYHVACLCGGHTIVDNNFFCGNLCRKIYSGLCKLVGVTHSLDKGFSWTLLHCIEEGDGSGYKDLKLALKNNSKLAVGLLVLEECFNPMDDPRTNIAMITHATYNRWSQFDRLNYVGFYTAVLERDDEIISVASIRIHGARIAEMPLIGTRHKYRRQGMCRLLVGVIEKVLCSLEVGTFILPAIPELFETWTHVFGFRPLESSQRADIKDLSMMMFPGTDLLQKPILKGPTGNTAVLQIGDSDVELAASADANSLDYCQKLERLADTKTDSMAQISDSELLQNENVEEDIFFDACVNFQSTDSSMMAETGTGSVSKISTGCPTGDDSPFTEGVLVGTSDRLEPSSGFKQIDLLLLRECDSLNAEGFPNGKRDEGFQEPEISCASLKGAWSSAAKDSLLATREVELQKTENNKQVDGGCNGSLNAEVTVHDAWHDGSQQSEPTSHAKQNSQRGVGIGFFDWESHKLSSDSAEPTLTNSAMTVTGNAQTSERLESACRLQSSKPSSDCMSAVSLFPGAGQLLNAVYIEETVAITQKPEPSPDSDIHGCGVSVTAKSNLSINANDNDEQKQKLVSDHMQVAPASLRKVGLSSTQYPFLGSRDSDPHKLESVPVEGPLIEEGVVTCKS